VIDYQGSLFKNVDIAYVLLCEIAHILCLELEESMRSKEGSMMTFENKKPDNMLSHEIAGQFHYFVRSLGCQLCGSELKGYSNWTSTVSLSETSRVIERQGGMNSKLPSSTLNLGVLRYYAKDYDDKIRRTFGTRMYHTNREANMKAIDEFEIESVHRPTLVKNDRWIKRFIDEFTSRVKRKMICECDGPLIAKALHSNV
jgi:hypothetical protein